MGEELAAIIVSGMVFAVPIIAIITSHQRKLAEIKARMGMGSDTAAASTIKSEISSLRVELNSLRNEVASLRDTTTTFDMSFDAAISRLEQRVDRLDETENVATPLRSMPPARGNDDTQIILGQKG
jgi:division protein CdvB (Snf7/Vps24/ESCRT-III family)